MQLTDPQIHALINGLSPFVHGAQAELRLISSRPHNKKGIEISLLMVADQAGVADNLAELKPVLLSNMKKFAGDHKIELKIVARDDVPLDPSLKSIVTKSILLHRW